MLADYRLLAMKDVINIDEKSPPVVELDSEACAAYVRFSAGRVVKTIELESDLCTVTADIGEDGGIVGIELVGVREFTLTNLLKGAGIRLSRKAKKQIPKARYVSARSVLAEAC